MKIEEILKQPEGRKIEFLKKLYLQGVIYLKQLLPLQKINVEEIE